MASTGLKRFRYALLNEDGETYEAVKTMAGAISASVSLNIAEATLYADDATKEYASEFTNGTITLGIDEDDDTIFAEILGKEIDPSGFVTSNVADTPPYVGFGHVVVKMVNNQKLYKVEFFPKTKFKPFIPDANTKGDSLAFANPSVEGMILANDMGNWEFHKTFTTEVAANAALDALFTQTSLTAPILAQPAGATDPVNVTGVQAGTLHVIITAVDGDVIIRDIDVTGDTAEIARPAGSWVDGMTVKARLILASGLSTPYSDVLTIAL
jgi:phi13 family phage major tail protein